MSDYPFRSSSFDDFKYFAVTGHRPDKLGGYGDAAQRFLKEFAKDRLPGIVKGARVITGMALGWDTAVALACVELHIPFIAAVPCENQDQYWHWSDKITYNWLLGKASGFSLVNREYTSTCMQERNQWMVDRCDGVIALWDGSTGGTKNCIDYAKRVDKPITNLYNIWKSYQISDLYE